MQKVLDPSVQEWSESCALWLIIGIAVWVQFPLGSARPWAWSLLALLVALAWMLWLPAAIQNYKRTIHTLRLAAAPLSLMAVVLFWVLIQSSSWSPASWHHAIWDSVHGIIGGSRGTISINPFDTGTEGLKLLAYIAIGWLSFSMCQKHESASLLLNALLFTGVGYAVYAFVLDVAGMSQVGLLEGATTQYGRSLTGGFGAKNSFATFAGISLLISLALLAQVMQDRVVARHGLRKLVRTAIQASFGVGLKWLLASFLLASALIGANSRAGLAATLCGIVVMFFLLTMLSARRGVVVPVLAAAIIAAGIFGAMIITDGDLRALRFDQLTDLGNSSLGDQAELRPVMWKAAEEAIERHPLTGIGLGAYHDAYHLYETQFVPFVIDRAHNDYLEFVAGIGVPAALIWLSAIGLIVLRCIIGFFTRRRRRIYSLISVAATVLVGIHSIFDFSLQIPAIAVTFSIILGIGAAQAYSQTKTAAFRVTE